MTGRTEGERRRRSWWWGVALVGLVIAVATLIPARPTTEPPPTLCLVCGSLGGIDVFLNVLLFIPLGVTLVAAGVPWPRAALTGMAASLAIETLQFVTIPGRDASLSDLLTNSTGTLLGALLAVGHRRWLVPTRAAALTLSLLSGLGAVGVTEATVRLLRPRMPFMALWGQLGPREHPDFVPFTGVVHRFVVNGVEIPYDRVAVDDLVTLHRDWGEPRGVAEITTGHPTTRMSAIARLGSRVFEVFFLGQDGRDLVFRTKLNSHTLRLRTPSIRLRGALPQAGERVKVEGAIEAHGWTARVRGAQRVMERHVPFSPSLGWNLLLPFDFPLGDGYRFFSALWLVALFFPSCYWGWSAGGGGRGRSGTAAMAIPCAAIVAALVWIPARHGLAPGHWSEWAGAVVALLLAPVLASLVHRRLNRLAHVP